MVKNILRNENLILQRWKVVWSAVVVNVNFRIISDFCDVMIGIALFSLVVRAFWKAPFLTLVRPLQLLSLFFTTFCNCPPKQMKWIC